MAYGETSAPANTQLYWDALVAQSVANYRKKLNNVISSSLSAFWMMKNRGGWETRNGGLYIAENLLYALTPMEPFSGYDILPLTPTDGVTQCQFDWRQCAAPLTISGKEKLQNRNGLENMLATKMQQLELGFQENFKKQWLLGSLAGSGSDCREPYKNNATDAQSLDPLPRMVMFDPTAVYTIGNIAQGTYSWWRNRTTTSAATTYSLLLAEMETMLNNVKKGVGNGTNINILTDQTTYELVTAAYYWKYRFIQDVKIRDFPFDGINFHGATLTWDEDIPDVYSSSGAGLANTATYGTMYFLNLDFMKIVSDTEVNFKNTPLVRPPNMDAEVSHCLWAGNSIVNNRLKHGVIGKIARTLTAS